MWTGVRDTEGGKSRVDHCGGVLIGIEMKPFARTQGQAYDHSKLKEAEWLVPFQLISKGVGYS